MSNEKLGAEGAGRAAALEEVRLMLEEQRKECLDETVSMGLNRIRADELDTALINLRALAAEPGADTGTKPPTRDELEDQCGICGHARIWHSSSNLCGCSECGCSRFALAERGTTPPTKEQILDACERCETCDFRVVDRRTKEVTELFQRTAERGTTPPSEQPLTQGFDLMQVTDARIWAQEFVRIAKKVHPVRSLSDDDIDWMQSWFASAITVGEMMERNRAATQRAPVEQVQPVVANIDLPRNEFEAAWAHYASTAPGTATEKNVFMAGWNAAAPDHAREGALRLECDSCGQDVTGEGYRPHRYVICHKPGCADKYTKNTLKLDKAISERRALADGKEGGE